MKRGLGMFAAALALAACGAPAAGGAAAAAGKSRPNVVVILADDLGYGDLSCYGAKALRTPNIDSLAKNGLRLTSGYAGAALCSASRACLMTGTYPIRRPYINVLSGESEMCIEPGSLTLAQLFRDAGYRTGVVGKWHLGLGRVNARQDWNKDLNPCPLDVGFTYSFIISGANSQVPTVFIENRRVVGLDPADPLYVSFKKNFPGEPTALTNPELVTKMMWNKTWYWRLNHSVNNGIGRQGYQKGGKKARWKDEELAETFSRHAIGFVERSAAEGKPFFLYYPLHQPHVPRVPNPAFAGKTPLGPRGDVIVEADWQVGELLKTLDRLGIAKDTIVIFTSDNGPVLDDAYEDRSVELNRKAGHRPSGILRGGKGECYDGGTHMPFLVQWKGTVAPGTESGALVCHVDFLASFAAMLGRSVPERIAGRHCDSENVLDALLGRSKKGRGELLLRSGTCRLALRSGKYYLMMPGQNFLTHKPAGMELYDLEADPSQKHDLAAELPDVAKRLAARVRAIQARR